MSIIIGLFILGAVLMLASFVFNLVFMLGAMIVAGVTGAIGWLYRTIKG